MKRDKLISKITKTTATAFLGVAAMLSLTTNTFAAGNNYFNGKGVWNSSYGMVAEEFLDPYSFFQNGDFDGDGKQDILVGSQIYAGDAPAEYKVLKNTGTSFIESSIPAMFLGSLNFVADIDGDRKDDIVHLIMDHNSSGTIGSYVWIKSNGSEFEDSVEILTHYANAADGFHVIDYNGDNKDDLLISTSRESTNGSLNWYLLESNGSAYINKGKIKTNYGIEGDRIDIGDFNGDGKQDVLLSETRTKPNNTRSWHMLQSTGTGFTDKGNIMSAYGNGADNVYIGDFNVDGKDDVMLSVSRLNQNGILDWYVALSNGTTFIDTGIWLDNFAKEGDWVLVGNFIHAKKADFAVAEPRSNGNLNKYRWWMVSSAY